MSRRSFPVLLTLVIAAAACADRESVTAPPLPAGAASPTAGARERLASRLASAMADPSFRATLRTRLARSRSPEGKIQFQALARVDGGVLVASLARGGSSVQEVLADLDAARGLELYLPVAAHRDAWDGGADVLVATAGADGEAPVAFTPAGARHVLDAHRPPATPVIALVPQETDFTGGRPDLATTCWDTCGGDDGGGSGGIANPYVEGNPGLYLTSSHFEDDHEGWLKGNPEYEYHVYGTDASGNAVQLACTGEHAGGAYAFDQNSGDWSGRAMLLSDTERATYEQANPGKPVRIVAFEDDDEACVPRIDGNRVAELLKAIDAAYKAYTSGKMDPFIFRGIKAAPSVFNLLKALRNAITTGDDFIGNGVEASIAGPMPGGVNWAMKTDGTKTSGWFATEYRR